MSVVTLVCCNTFPFMSVIVMTFKWPVDDLKSTEIKSLVGFGYTDIEIFVGFDNYFKDKELKRRNQQ